MGVERAGVHHLAAVCTAFLLGDGLASAFGGLERASFGFRQIGSSLLTAVLVLGLSLQALAAMVGDWAIGGSDQVPAVVGGAGRRQPRAPTTWCGSAR